MCPVLLDGIILVWFMLCIAVYCILFMLLAYKLIECLVFEY